MFEKYLENLLQSYLGEYIEDLDKQSLSVSLWNGDVKLSNLKLKANALNLVDQPFTIKFSHLGTLVVNVPWSNLNNKPLTINLDQLVILVQPDSVFRFSQLTVSEKFKQIEAYKNSLIKKLAEQKSSNGMISKMIQRAVDNIQLTIKNIHIRVEDSNCSYGVVLEQLQCITINEKGQEQFIDRQQAPLRKLFTVTNFSIYWNTVNDKHMNLEAMLESIRDYNNNSYLFQLNLQSTLYEPQIGSSEKMNLEVTLQEISLALSKKQMQQALRFVEKMSQYQDQLRYYRTPKISKEEKQQLLAQFREQYFVKEQKELVEVVSKLTMEDLKQEIKLLVKQQKQQELIQQLIKKQQKKSWWSDNTKKQELSEEELRQIDQYLNDNFMNESLNLDIPPDFVWMQVQLRLLQGQISIINDHSSIQTLFNNFQLDVGIKGDGKDIELRLQEFSIRYLQSNESHYLFQKSFQQQQDQDFLYVKFQKTQTGLEISEKLKLTIHSSKFHFHPSLLQFIAEISNISIQDEKLKNAAIEKIDEIQNEAQKQLTKTIQERKKVEIEILVQSCFIMIPIPSSQAFWLFNPGLLKISTPENNSKNEQFKLVLQNICFSHCQNLAIVEDQMAMISKKQIVENAIVKNFKIKIQLDLIQKQNLKNVNDPSMIVDGQIEQIAVQLTPEDYRQLLKLSECFEPQEKMLVKRKESQEEAEQRRDVLLKNALKVGPLYKQNKNGQWQKYTCVLCGSYLYFYDKPKSPEASEYKYVKDSDVELSTKADSSGMYSLKVVNAITEFAVAIDKPNVAAQWVEEIVKIKSEQKFLEELLEEDKKQEEQKVV